MTVKAKHWVKVSCGWVQPGEVFEVNDMEFKMISDAVEVLVEDPQSGKVETLVEESAARVVDGKNADEPVVAPEPTAPRKRGRKKV